MMSKSVFSTNFVSRLWRVIKYTLLDIKYGSWYLGTQIKNGDHVKKFAEQILGKVKAGLFTTQDRPIIIYYNCNSRLYIFENSQWKIKHLGELSHTKLNAAIIEPTYSA